MEWHTRKRDGRICRMQEHHASDVDEGNHFETSVKWSHEQTIIAHAQRGSKKAQTPSCMNWVTHSGARISRMDRKNFFIVRLNSKMSRLRGPMLIHARQGCTGKVDSQLPFLCLCAMHGSALQGAPTEILLS